MSSILASSCANSAGIVGHAMQPDKLCGIHTLAIDVCCKLSSVRLRNCNCSMPAIASIEDVFAISSSSLLLSRTMLSRLSCATSSSQSPVTPMSPCTTSSTGRSSYCRTLPSSIAESFISFSVHKIYAISIPPYFSSSHCCSASLNLSKPNIAASATAKAIPSKPTSIQGATVTPSTHT